MIHKIKVLVNKLLIALFKIKIVKENSKLYLDYTDLNLNIKQIQDNQKPIIFDCGARDGSSVKRFKKLYPNSEIHCFEPVKTSIKKIQENYKNDNSIILNNCGVGDANEKKVFNEHEHNVGISSFREIKKDTAWAISRLKNAEKSPKKYEVNIITLDKYCSENNINQINILKIDVQGYETNVLEGAKNLLKFSKIDLIEMELHHENLYNFENSYYELEKYLIPNNYRLFSVSRGGSLLHHKTFKQDIIYISDKLYQKNKEKILKRDY